MKKALALILSLLMILSFASCKAEKNSPETFSDALNIIEPVSDDKSTAPATDDAVKPPKPGSKDTGGVADDRSDIIAGEASPELGDGVPADGEFDYDMMTPAEAVDSPSQWGCIYPTAGLLTAGEWSDLKDLNFWSKLLNRNDWYSQMVNRNLYTNNIKSVYVHDTDNAPCFNAEVELLADDSSVLFTAKTDITGHAYLAYNLNNEGKTPAKVRVRDVTVDLAQDVTDVTLDPVSNNVNALDLMFMIDTTASMGDELRYIQKELEDVIKRVSNSADNVLSIRISINFYRDEGDEYVVRAFDFSNDIELAVHDLMQQNVDGGGDYPEAVDRALQNGINEHQWRYDAVKLMFLVLDAPPHDSPDINARLRDVALNAAESGIRVIPVASSGVNTETEFLMRSYAVLTGGTYIFLTNHSGIGGEHLEPTVGDYDIEFLNECLVRVICEYCGLEYKAVETPVFETQANDS